jgi:hypothetical protein
MLFQGNEFGRFDDRNKPIGENVAKMVPRARIRVTRIGIARNLDVKVFSETTVDERAEP